VRTILQRSSEVFALVYFLVLIAVSLLEWAIPHRPQSGRARLRWFSNFALSILDGVVVRSLFPMTAVAWAVVCRDHGWGLLNQVVAPGWLAFGITFLTLDLVYYSQHRLLHAVPLFWRFHRAHHTDHECDFSTGVRFHPFEPVFTTVAILAGLFALGAPPAAVFAVQLYSAVFSFVEHANVRVPQALDRVARLVVVTPDMHRIHHSRNVREGNANFANLFPVWDRLFATYLDRPSVDVTFGVDGFEERKHLTLPWMLAQPFLKPAAHVEAAPDIDSAVPGRGAGPTQVA
jgi:sterol desaturase/sphingolipid hydroxylase (fatty acid hydroxylase superfamily)